MGLRESLGEMDTGVQILLVLLLIPVVLVVVALVFVAVTVVLAAIVGTLVVGLADEADTAAPRVAFDWHVEGGTVEIVHDGGDRFAADRVVVAVNGDAVTWASLDPDASGIDQVTVGASVTVTGVSSGDTIRIVWTSLDGDSTETIGEYEVP